MKRQYPWMLALMFLTTGEANAHHSFAMFDNTKEVWLEGTIADFQWANPHTWIQVTVQGANGAADVEWSLVRE